ncbi:MAG: cell division FtsZ family protein [Paludibacteraceae bacterium]|nr:cell division FtsZ family protein [Paludibacteraceae bacterium]
MKSIVDKFIGGGSSAFVKVIGVGGGGCNAVENLYKRGLDGVSYAVCNTDIISLQACCVPTRLAIGDIGAGDIPEKGYEAAEKYEEEIRKVLKDDAKMLFITAGMGGGTGSGASLVVARIARELDLLTVGIVTIPFAFEGKHKINKAYKWIKKMEQFVDAMIVINNQRLTEMPGYLLPEAFRFADEVLANAAESIVKLVVLKGYMNVDIADVFTTLRSGKNAVICTGEGEGESRVSNALDDAVGSVLIDDVDLEQCSRVLLNFYCSRNGAMTTQELKEVEAFTGRMLESVDVVWGINYDDTLGDKIKVTVLASY